MSIALSVFGISKSRVYVVTADLTTVAVNGFGAVLVCFSQELTIALFSRRLPVVE
jgi:hypothetical protein